jgi:abhydrolase domain-containing protein 6
MFIRFLHNSIRSKFRSMGFESRSIDAPVGRLHFLIREQADAQGTLMLIHGLGTSSSTWIKILPHIGRRHTMILPDLPGFGRSTVRDGRGYCTLREHAAAIAHLHAHLGVGPVVLAGQSLGGWVSGLYASDHPDRVKRLVFIDTAGVYYRGVENLRQLFSPQSVRETRTMLNALWYRYPWYFKPFAGAVFRDLLAHHMHELVDAITEQDFLVDELTRLTMPVDVIWGKEDKVISQQSVDVLRKFVPQAKVVTIDRCGHVPQLECPRACADVLRRILEEESA